MASSLPSTEPGASIGPYRIVASLGTGGMGQVLQVVDSRNGQIRALKMRYLDRSRPRGSDYQIHREYRVLSRCNHPNIAKAYELSAEPGFVYLILEYVQGKPLDRYLAELEAPPGARRDRLMAFLALQMASALEHLHGRRLVHRDLKPGNVMVAPNDVVKLIDFGIAQDLTPSAAAENAEHAGTYAYCSPEQLSEQPTDHRSDLYSLGIVFYEMITGHLPFQAENPLAFVVKHLTRAPTPLDTFYPSVPPSLNDLVLRLLAKKPIERPQRSRDVSKVLRQFVEQFDEDRRGPWLAQYRRNVELEAGERPLCEPAFVGRAYELSQLEGAFTLLSAGVGGALLLHGPVGMGKARLLEEALISARAEGFAVCVARCLPHAEEPFQGLLELVEQAIVPLSGQSPELLVTMLGEHLVTLRAVLPVLSRVLSSAVPDGADPLKLRVDAEHLSEALEAFIQRAPSMPTVMVLKDLQWADPLLLSLLGTLVSAPPDPLAAPVLWLASASTDELGVDHPLSMWLRSPPPLMDALAIRPLKEEDVEPMVSSMLGQAELGELPLELFRQSGGNPLHIIEAVSDQLERGTLCYLMGEEETTGYFSSASSPDSDTSPVTSAPVTLLELLRRRLAHVSEHELRLLEAMAVLGRPSRLEWLQAVTGWPPETLLEVVEQLVERRILTERVGRGYTVYVFVHPKTPEVVKESIATERLPALCLEAAESWKKVFGDESSRSVELIADLLFQGRAYEQAVTYLLKAATDYVQLSLHGSAQRLLERAMGCCAKAPQIDRRLEAQANLRMGEVLDRLQRPEVALAYLQTALELSQAHGYADLNRQTLEALALSSERQGDYRLSSKRYEACLASSTANGSLLEVAPCLLGSSEAYARFGNIKAVEASISSLLTKLPPVRHVPYRAASLYYLSRCALSQGRASDALITVSQANGVAMAVGERLVALRCDVLEADIRRQLGELGLARARAAKATESLSRQGEPVVLAEALCVLAATCLEIRDSQRAQALLERIHALLEEMPNPWLQTVLYLLKSLRHLVEGRARQSLLDAVRAHTLAQEEGFLELGLRAQLLRAVGNIRQGAIAEGVQLASFVLHSSDTEGYASLSLEASLTQAEGLVVLGKRDEATSVLELIIEGAFRWGLALTALRALTLRGRLAREQGQLEVALPLFRRAEKLASSIVSGLAVEDRPLFEGRPEVKLLRHLLKTGSRS